MFIIPVTQKVEQEDTEFKASLDYRMRYYLKNKNKQTKNEHTKKKMERKKGEAILYLQ
jgi:hypothetical protein